MKYSLTLAVAGFLLPVVLASPQAADSPCGDCGDLERKETDCTTPEKGLQEHAECMCGNNFFTEWRKCRTCLFNVEQTPQEIYNDNMQAIKKVEYSFCEDKQPQALFQQAFNALGNPESMPAVGVNSVSASPSTPGETASASAQDSAGFPSTSGSFRPTTTTAFSSTISLTASTTSGTDIHSNSSSSSSSSSGGSRITPGTGRNSTASSALPTGAAVPAVQAATGLAMALLSAATLIGL